MGWYIPAYTKPLTKKERRAFTIFGLLTAPIGIGLTSLLVPVADSYRKREEERASEHAKKVLEGKIGPSIHPLGDPFKM